MWRLIRFRHLGVVVLLAAFALTAVYSAWDRQLAANISTGSIEVDGETRSYRILVPRMRLDPCPLVFAFHGVGDSAESMASYSQFDKLAASKGFILVYPTARKSMWTTTADASAPSNGNRDVRFFDLLLEKISNSHCVDTGRIYAVGMSNGGSFVQLLGHSRAEVIAAIVAHSGTCPHDLPATGRRCPLLMVVDANDSALGAIKADSERYHQRGHPTELIVVEGLGHEWSVKSNQEIWEFLKASSIRP